MDSNDLNGTNEPVTRESMEYDVVIVGAGPAGLAAAIRLKQLNADTSVVLLEKGSEVGAHILSGAVLDTIGLEKLFPNFRDDASCPVKQKVTSDHLTVLGKAGSVRVPNFVMPPLMNNHGKYIVSMGAVARWMGDQAEALGVEIFPGMACSELLYREDGSLKGVVAGEFGYEKDASSQDGIKGPNYEPGMELHGKYVLLAEGARGSLSQIAMEKYGLRDGVEPQKFGLGMKEVWEVKPENHEAGKVYHSAGWPLGMKRGGGSFLYHAENNQVYLGMIVDLNYDNPHVYPYMEFQRWKHHPDLASVLEGGKRISYGARVVTKGGYQSLPQAAFPGGALLGCSVGLVNLPRIKGNHNAMLSGVAAAEAADNALQAGRSADTLADYDREIHEGEIGADLKPVRNVAALNGRFGPFLGGMVLGGADMWCQTLFKFSPFGTLSHRKNDAKSTGKAADHKPIDYPKPDGVLSFDRLTNVSFTNTYHGENQPSHLKLLDPTIPIAVNLPVFDEPAQRYCPAGVYEVVVEDGKDPKFVINSQNCIHCKTCDIKDPSENILWTVPEGGGGPNYAGM